jgi:hypothetical protein
MIYISGNMYSGVDSTTEFNCPNIIIYIKFPKFKIEFKIF